MQLASNAVVLWPNELEKNAVLSQVSLLHLDNFHRSFGLKDHTLTDLFSTDKRYIKRDVDSVLATSHKSDLTGFTQYVSPSYLFGLNSSCALEAGDVTEGESLRSDRQNSLVSSDLYIPKVHTSLRANTTGQTSGKTKKVFPSGLISKVGVRHR